MMNKRSYWMLQWCLLVFTIFATSAGFAQGITDRFRAFVLDSHAADAAEMPPGQFAPPLQSHQCMECHDGNGGQRIALKHAESAMRFIGHSTVDHPVGMQYARYAYDNPQVYVSPDQLDERIVLENGEVTCLSCHAIKSHLYAGLDSGLAETSTMTNGQTCSATDSFTTGTSSTTLCLSCHAL